jgi:hypothetical protein
LTDELTAIVDTMITEETKNCKRVASAAREEDVARQEVNQANDTRQSTGFNEEKLAKLVELSVKKILKSVLAENFLSSSNRNDARSLDRLLGN